MSNSIIGNLYKGFRANLRSYILIIALLMIWIVFGITQPAYLSATHVQNVFQQMSIIGIMACGMVFVIVTNGIDLSVGYGAGFISVVAAGLLYYGVSDGIVTAIGGGEMNTALLSVLSSIVTVVLSMGVAVLFGVIQGSLIARLGIPAFIVTLGFMFIFKSGLLLVTQGKSLFIAGKETYKFIGQGLLPSLMGYAIAGLVSVSLFVTMITGRSRKAKYGIEQKSFLGDILKTGAFVALLFGYVAYVDTVGGVPFPVLLLGIVAALMSYISNNTRYGRYTYAIGGNREAARLSGINIKKQIFQIFVAMGTLSGLAGVVLAANVGSGTTGAGGGYELDVIASCFLGGTSTLGGEGTVFGAIIGALIMQSLSNGLQMANVNSNLQYAIKGVVLILAVLADIKMKQKKVA